MLKSMGNKLKRIAVCSIEYEYTYSIENHIPTSRLEHDDPKFALLTYPEQAQEYTWEAGERELVAVRRLLSGSDVIGILHQHGVVYARLALRTKGWVSTESQRRYRKLQNGEGYFHFMRTAKLARGNGYQVKLHAPYYETESIQLLESLTSTCNVNNIASIKGIERSGGIRTKRIWSVGFLGGRFGFSLTRPYDHEPIDGRREQAN